ncbi:MAG: hypothetical protein HN919_12090 [Verrucomicrobia bacterium]|jgi:hypothetical protein|nr:hypothetical protein [Verrucomicrobiota bacterium]MBT7067038.1 hypothetical protein [Verrucomicrobiota bacterium]MBT7699072.1 hypothetical protein [Verrucomicrobiota bacterium]
MMAQWIHEAALIVRELIGSCGSTTEYNVLLGLAVAGLLFGLFNISAAMGATMSTPLRVTLVSVLGGLLVMAAVVAVRLYLIPNLTPSPMLRWLPLVVSGMVLLLCVAPLAKWLLSAGYFEAVFALVLSCAAVALLIVLGHAGFNALRTGDKGFNKTQHRRDSINQIIDDV